MGTDPRPSTEDTPSGRPVSQPRTYHFGPFTVDVPAQRLYKDSEAVPMTGRVFDTLLALIRNRDRVVSKDELMQMVWHDAVVSEDSLTQSISILRRTLHDDSANPHYIGTNARRGYRFIADVIESEAPARPQPPGAELSPRHPQAVPLVGSWRANRWMWVAAAGSAVAVAAATGVLLRGSPIVVSSDSPPRVHFSIEAPASTQLASGGVVSPDGRHVAFVARDVAANRLQLWVRSVESGEFRMLPGTEGATLPFWAPDSAAIGFFVGQQIKRVGLASHDPVRVIGAKQRPSTSGGSWSPAGVIVYGDGGSLYSTPVSGGPATLLKRWGGPGAEFVWLSNPQVIGNGDHILYAVNSTDPERAGTYFGTLTSPSSEDIRVLPEWGEGVAYSRSGHLVFIRNQVVMAQPLDASSGRLHGEAVPIAGTMVAHPAVSVADQFVLTFGGGVNSERVAWVDREGSLVAPVTGVTGLRNPVLSRDEKRLLGDTVVQPFSGAWNVDLERNVPSRVVRSQAARRPQWSPDDARIAFTAQQGRVRGIFVTPASATTPELLLDTDEVKFVSDWTDDGRYLIFVSTSAATKQDLWLLPTFGDRKPRPILRTPANEMQGRVSPDGRWIAYASDETGRYEVYVDSFPTPGAKITLSNGGGAQPQWRSDGRELYFLTADGALMAVPVRGGATLQVAPAQPLFKVSLPGSLLDDRNVYAVGEGGRRFLVTTMHDDSPREPINVVVNWTATPGRGPLAAE